MIKILIGTANKKKIVEIKELLDVPSVEFVTLEDINFTLEPPEETGKNLYENARIKAIFYAEQTGLLTLSEDTGFFINSLDGWPGIYAARVADTQQQKIEMVLKKMQGITDRSAAFRTVAVLYNPKNKSEIVTQGEALGTITETYNDQGNTFGYDPIFFSTEANDTFANIPIKQKNACSHRAKAIVEMSYNIRKLHEPKQFVVPMGIVIKDGKVLMQKRNDPHNKNFHLKWEFPGGGIDAGEKIEEALIRETKEEAGYDVEIIKRSNYIHNVTNTTKSGFTYTLFLVPYLCKIISGDGTYQDKEVLDVQFFEPSELLAQDVMPENDIIISKLLPEINAIIQKN